MSNIMKKAGPQDAALYPIRTVSDLTNVNAITLRAWERRYGLFEPVRKASGHRLYTQANILLLACLPGDRHEAGLLLFALAANAAGYRVILLGADMPLDELPAAVRKTGCAAIILSGILHPESEVLKALPALTGQSDVPVFLGGYASVKVHDALKRAGVIVLGTDLKSGLTRLLDAVPVE